jgi:hypothetical protein
MKFSIAEWKIFLIPKLGLIFLLLFSSSSCTKATYSTDKLEEGLINLCKNEYKLPDVQVKTIGSTLGVFVPVDGLIDADFKLDQKSSEKIEDVAISIHRVTTSTDSPVKFYVLTARDTNMTGAEFILTGFTYDVVRVRLLDVSRGEYFKRILRDFRFNPSVTGLEKVKQLFSGLNMNSPEAESLKPFFYPIFSIGKPNTQKIEIKSIKAKEISANEALLHVKTNEFYEPAKGFESLSATFPSGFSNEYLFLVDTALFQNSIKEIVPKYFHTNSEIRQRNIEETFGQYKDIGFIDINGFPKKSLDMPWFLGEQISRRIKNIQDEGIKFNKPFHIQNSFCELKDKSFSFKFNLSSDNPISEKDEQIILSEIVNLAATVLHRYDFTDFEGAEFVDTKTYGRKIYLSRDELELFKDKKIKIEDILFTKFEYRNSKNFLKQKL